MGSHRAPTGRRRAKRLATVAAVAVATTLVVVGAQGLWERHQALSPDDSSPAAVGTPTPNSDAEFPDESPVPADSCEAADDEPQKISLGSLDVTGCIQKVGLEGRQIQAPSNIHVAGWYTGSASPGSNGLSIIDGHSTGRYTEGVFNRIGDFDVGEVFTVEYGDGSVRRFEVADVAEHPVASTMDRLYADASAQEADLALITCGGNYDAANHKFDRRVVVLAHLT